MTLPPISTASPQAEALLRGLLESPRVDEDIASIRDRANEWYQAIAPRNRFHAWLVDQVAILTIRVDRSERIERRLRDRHSLRAELSWDADRRREAEALGAGLSRRPGETVEALRATPQGCDWLIGRWALLARAAEAPGSWSPEQAALASDLLGTPPEFRDTPIEAPADIARRQSEALRTARDQAARLDEVDRALARADLSDEANQELKRLRRHESTLHTRLRWTFAQLKAEPPKKAPDPEYRPRWVERPAEPAEAPAEKPLAVPHGPSIAAALPARSYLDLHPPFDLEPHEFPEPGREVDIPAILAGRRARRARQAEARIDARRRKLERLRA